MSRNNVIKRLVFMFSVLLGCGMMGMVIDLYPHLIVMSLMIIAVCGVLYALWMLSGVVFMDNDD